MKKLLVAIMLLALAGTGRAEFANKIGKMVVGYGETRSTLVNYPVLVRVTADQAAACREDGADILFTSLDGKTSYPHEIDVWNREGESTVWVRLPEMKNGTIFVMHWGDPDYEGPAEEQAMGAVWSAAGYAGVWHMTEESGTVANVTANGSMMDAVPVGARAQYSVRSTVAAPIGYARDMGAEDVNHDVNGRALLKVANYDSLALGDTFTLSGWFRIKDYHGNYDNNHRTRNARFFARKTVWSDDKGYILSLANDITKTNFRGGGNGNGHTPTIPSCKDNWVHLAWVFDGTTIRSYANGKDLGSATIGRAEDNGLDLGMGSQANVNANGEYANDSYLVGMMDEARLQDLQGDVNYGDWFAAEYAMGADKAFLSEFEVSGEGEDAKITLAAPALVYENDIVDSELVVSRPPDASTPYLQVSLSYEGDTSMVSGLPDSVVFAAGKETVTIPFRAIDDGEKSGDRSFTVKVAPGEGYEAAQEDGITVTVVDDESSGGEVVWTGAAGNLLWDDPGNWDPKCVPGFNDSPRFTSSGLTANDTVLIGSNARIAKLIIETVTPFTLGVAGAGGASLMLKGVERRDVEGNEGYFDFKVPLAIAPSADGFCYWQIEGSSSVRIYAHQESAVADTTLVKTGAGTIELRYEWTDFRGPWDVREGQVRTCEAAAMSGKISVGGYDTTASVSQDKKNCFRGTTVAYVYANGTFNGDHDLDNGRCEEFHVFKGGVMNISYYFYSIKAFFSGGGTINGGRMFNGGWNQTVNYAKGDGDGEMATFNSDFGLAGGYDFSVPVEDGAAPVDLLMTKRIDGGGNDKTMKKTGAGTLKSTAGWGINTKVSVEGGRWFIDNPADTTGTGSQPISVTGGLLGGVGMVYGANANVTASNSAKIAPGTIDTITGVHSNGTFTVGNADNANSVTFNGNSVLEVAVGVGRVNGRKATLCDKLNVFGAINVAGAGATLSVVLADPEQDIRDLKGGEFVIAEAAGGISGTFANVQMPEGARWKVRYEENRIVLSIPDRGMVIYVK